MNLFKDTIHNDDNLSLPLEIEGGYWDGTFRRFLAIFSCFLIILIGLGFLAPIREVAFAEGEIVPVGSTVEVEHFEGGVVDEVFVKAGDLVQTGDVIMRLREETGAGDFNQVSVRLDHLELRRLRLIALLKGSEPDYSAFAAKYPEDTKDQKLLFDSEKAAVAAAGRILKARLEQRLSDIKAREREHKAVFSQIEILNERLFAQRKLIQKGFSSRANLLAVKSDLEEVKAQEAQLAGAIEASKASVLEVENEIIQAQNSKRQEWSDLLLTTVGEMAELKERLAGSKDRVDRLVIKATATGRVQALGASQKGQVIRPGDVVAEIVPNDAVVEAEVKILPGDIGHIDVGHQAEITLSTFDPEVFGKVKGEVRSISPTTFETDQGDKYYRGLIQLNRSVLKHKGQEFLVSPGMVVTASIRTGKKSVMTYMLKPVFRSYDRAFSER